MGLVEVLSIDPVIHGGFDVASVLILQRESHRHPLGGDSHLINYEASGFIRRDDWSMLGHDFEKHSLSLVLVCLRHQHCYCDCTLPVIRMQELSHKLCSGISEVMHFDEVHRLQTIVHLIGVCPQIDCIHQNEVDKPPQPLVS